MTIIQVVQPDGETFTGTIESGAKVSVNGGAPEDRYVVVKQDGTKTFVFPSRAQIQAVDTTVPQVAAPSAQVPGAGPMPNLAHLMPTPGAGSYSAPPPLPPEIAAMQAIGGPDPVAVSMPLPGSPGADATTPISFSNQAPPPGSSRGGSQLAQPLPPPAADEGYIPPPSAPALPPAQAPRPRPERFMVQPKSGKAKVFHTREDCGKVAPETPRLPMDDDAIAFFELVVCQSCQRRDKQMTFPEALADALAENGITIPLGTAAAIMSKITGWGFNVSPQAVDR